MYLGLPGLATDVYTLYVHILSLPSPLRHPPSTISSHTLLNLQLHFHYIIRVSRHTDVPRSHDQFRLRVNMYTIKEEREITPVTFAHLVSSTLYERRFGPYFIEPVAAGLEPIPMPGAAESAAEGGEGERAGSGKKAKRRYKPLIASMDLIGCINWANVLILIYQLPNTNLDVGAGAGAGAGAGIGCGTVADACSLPRIGLCCLRDGIREAIRYGRGTVGARSVSTVLLAILFRTSIKCNKN
jgi:hypothetical protein